MGWDETGWCTILYGLYSYMYCTCIITVVELCTVITVNRGADATGRWWLKRGVAPSLLSFFPCSPRLGIQ